ncbi:PucR family transcriptional regulator [Nocardiopsis changdeensis]|uniref:Helix-turn-helix domain-containing protein n=1 Tax=Nocardiopsis changdeensis TaxID=2831969 RepID=A0ABX8BU24_9ACTN|nr:MULTISPECIES: PucR family transcriptional regulator [Nocardiopsis]QUX24321.1 helix-turn-helix domain-containing protein [Nocardiopsis changdeensis]QYX34712.1 helix-turn-helix domain-containing protein [Nocardiopsis sp. MT53]
MTRPPRESGRTDPFSDIPPEVGARMRSLAPVLVEEALAGIHHRLGEALVAPDAKAGARRLLDIGVKGFMERLGTGRGPDEALLARFRAFGAHEAGHGRGLERLHAGMRVIAAAVWRVLSDDDTLSRDLLGPLGEAVLLFEEELGEAAAQGHARVSAAGADASRHRRTRFLEALLAGVGRDPAAVAALARGAHWRTPERAAVVLLHPGPAGEGAARPDALPPSLPPDALVDLERPEPCALVPDPEGPGRLRALERSLRGSCAVLGPSVPLERVPESLERARELAELVRSGAVPGEGLVRWDDHLLALLLSRDPALLSAMARSRLAPLAELRPHQRERMAQTLLAWLEAGSNANEAAERLHIHPQTVRYRMRRLEELFGARLRDPGERFELELVLRARRLPGTVEGP